MPSIECDSLSKVDLRLVRCNSNTRIQSSRALDWFGLDRKSSDETGEEKLLDRAERQYCIARGLALCSAHEVKSTAAMIYTSHLSCCKLIVQGERSTRRLHQPL